MANSLRPCAQDEAALLLHLSGTTTTTTTDSAANAGTFTVFVDSSLDTHLAVSLSPHDTVADLKRKIRIEHNLCFPALGEIVVHAMKVRCRRFLYHLSDSMLVRSAFGGQMKTWFLHMDVSTLCMLKHREGPGQGFSTELIDVQVQIPESLQAISCKQVNQTSGRFVGSPIQESKDSEDASKLHIFSNGIGNLHEGDHLLVDIPDESVNPDNQLLHAENAKLENAKFVLSEQTIQHNSEGHALKASNMVGEDPISDYKASISGQKRAMDFNNPQNCDTDMHPNVDSRCEELEDNCHGLPDGAVSSAAAQSKSKKRNRDHCGPSDDITLESLLAPIPIKKMGIKKKKKKVCFIGLDRPLKVDETVSSYHTAEKSEFEKLAASNSEEKNCTPCEDLKREYTSASDLVKAKSKKKSVFKGYEVDHGNLISHQEVVEGQCSRKDSQTSLKETVDVTNLDNQNVMSQDGKSKHFASEKMDEKGSKIFPLLVASGSSESATARKRKKPKRAKYDEAEAPLVNHNVFPDDGSLSVHDRQNTIDNNVDMTDQLVGTKLVEKVDLSAETKQAGVQHTKSGSEMLTSMEGADNDVVWRKQIFGGEDGMASKGGKRKKSEKAAPAAAVERYLVPQVGDALNILPLGLEHTELMHDRSSCNNEGGSKKKENNNEAVSKKKENNNEAVSKKKENNNEASRKNMEKLHGKIKNADSEAYLSNSQLLSSSTRNEKCGHNEQGLSKMRSRTLGALTSMPSQERNRNSNMMSSDEVTAEVNMYDDDGCFNSSARVKSKGIRCLQKNSLNFIEYFAPGVRDPVPAMAKEHGENEPPGAAPVEDGLLQASDTLAQLEVPSHAAEAKADATAGSQVIQVHHSTRPPRSMWGQSGHTRNPPRSQSAPEAAHNRGKGLAKDGRHVTRRAAERLDEAASGDQVRRGADGGAEGTRQPDWNSTHSPRTRSATRRAR